MKTITRGALVACLLLMALILAVPVERSSGAKPKPPSDPPPPPLPPVRYVIQFWDVPNAGTFAQKNSMNNLGQIVGWYRDLNGEQRAFLYDPWVDRDRAVDLEVAIAGAGVPDGWKIASAAGINDQGIIVGYLAPLASPINHPIRQGYILDTNAPAPEVVILPNWGDWSFTFAIRINENGDISGVYRDMAGSYFAYFYNPAWESPLYLKPALGSSDIDLNNPLDARPAQIGGLLADGTPFRWTPELDLLEVFTDLNNPRGVRRINDSGTLCGSVDVTVTQGTGKKKTTSTETYPMRLSTATSDILTGAPGGWARSINSAGDVVVVSSLFYRDDWGYLNPDDLVIGSDDQFATWFSSTSRTLVHINNRDSTTDFGQLSGTARFLDGSYSNFLLTPMLAP